MVVNILRKEIMILLLKEGKKNKLFKAQYFGESEFLCPCCGYGLVDTELLILLDRIRGHLGIPIKVNSGYRCPAHNKAIGGADLSRHLIGCAADITWAGAVLQMKEGSTFRNFIDSLSKSDVKLYGVGWGNTFIHVDTDVTRKSFTQWTY